MCTRHHALIRRLIARIRELEEALESAEEAQAFWEAAADRNARAARAASVRAGDVQGAEYAARRGRSWW